jgi:hypothetical protein
MNDPNETFLTEPGLQALDERLRQLPKPTAPLGLAERIAIACADPFFCSQLDDDLHRLDTLLQQHTIDSTAPAELARHIYYATVEHLQQLQLDHELRPLDAQLRESLRPEVPEDLADRIFERTIYQLSAESEPPSRAVLARLSWERVISYSAMAAAIAMAIGAGIWMRALNTPSGTPGGGVAQIPTPHVAPIDDTLVAFADQFDQDAEGEVAEAEVSETDLELMALAIELDQLEMDVAYTPADPVDRQIDRLMKDLDAELF